MAGVRIELNEAGIRELLRSQGVRDELLRRAQRIAEAAGGAPDYEADSSLTHHRARATVWTATPEAMRAEATDRALTRAFDAGRG